MELVTFSQADTKITPIRTKRDSVRQTIACPKQQIRGGRCQREQMQPKGAGCTRTDAGLYMLARARDASWEQHTVTGAPEWLELDCQMAEERPVCPAPSASRLSPLGQRVHDGLGFGTITFYMVEHYPCITVSIQSDLGMTPDDTWESIINSYHKHLNCL